MAIVKIEWTEECYYSTYVELPEGETLETFDPDNYDLTGGLAELNTDDNYGGCERRDILVSNEVPSHIGRPPYPVDELDWETLVVSS